MKKTIGLTVLLTISTSVFASSKIDYSNCLKVLNTKIGSTYYIDAQEAINNVKKKKINIKKIFRVEYLSYREMEQRPEEIKFITENNELLIDIFPTAKNFLVEEDRSYKSIIFNDFEVHTSHNEKGLVKEVLFVDYDETKAVVVTNLGYNNNKCNIVSQEIMKISKRDIVLDNWEKTYVESECREIEQIDFKLGHNNLKNRLKKNRENLSKFYNSQGYYAPTEENSQEYDILSAESVKLVLEYKEEVNYKNLSDNELINYLDNHSKSIDDLFKRDSRLDDLDRYSMIHNVYKKYHSEIKNKLNLVNGKVEKVLRYSTVDKYGDSKLINDNFLSEITQKLLTDYNNTVQKTCDYIEL